MARTRALNDSNGSALRSGDVHEQQRRFSAAARTAVRVQRCGLAKALVAVSGEPDPSGNAGPALLFLASAERQRRDDIAALSSASARRCRWNRARSSIIGPALLLVIPAERQRRDDVAAVSQSQEMKASAFSDISGNHPCTGRMIWEAFRTWESSPHISWLAIPDHEEAQPWARSPWEASHAST
jgi:hypothetical protein